MCVCVCVLCVGVCVLPKEHNVGLHQALAPRAPRDLVRKHKLCVCAGVRVYVSG